MSKKVQKAIAGAFIQNHILSGAKVANDTLQTLMKYRFLDYLGSSVGWYVAANKRAVVAARCLDVDSVAA